MFTEIRLSLSLSIALGIAFLGIVQSNEAHSQAPEAFNYQAVVRDGSGDLVTNAPVGVQISILQGSATGSAVYTETHSPTSNNNGLITLTIGQGTVVSGAFAAIDWSAGPYFLETETDPTGGTSYTVSSTSQLLSVPFALLAEDVVNDPKQVRYFADSQPESSYEDLEPYVVELSTSWPAGDSKELPLAVILDYCADEDGCKLYIHGERDIPEGYFLTNAGFMSVNPDPATNHAWTSSSNIDFRAGNMGSGDIPIFTDSFSGCRLTTRSWSGGSSTLEPTTLHLVKVNSGVNTCTIRIED